ncbi:unnamed protein product [Didymodactylos carnosus]|uniref:ADP-ribosylglycohydrolase n=1 Tax=Didymodactylos carnosus TaxID=1234261 RepID=A0A815TIK7_9BILA|nr:unnamed protein product [Didymodactylos carnosus]CAF4363044.1 unnamed protein product [Didymodactylos carnosus]
MGCAFGRRDSYRVEGKTGEELKFQRGPTTVIEPTKSYPYVNNNATVATMKPSQQQLKYLQQPPLVEIPVESLPAELLNTTDKKPADMHLDLPPSHPADKRLLDKIYGSMLGMAIGDALGAHVEFRPRAYLEQNPVQDLQGGGTWGLEAGQWTDDTSMALCLAASLIAKKGFDPYDQLVRYKWWWRKGYMSSTGKCFDIGNSTKAALDEFVKRQHQFAQEYHIQDFKELDLLPHDLSTKFDTKCSREDVDSNGSLMRLAPVPLFFCQATTPVHAIYYAGVSSEITHGGQKAVDACRFYASLLYAALNGTSKKEFMDRMFYDRCFQAGWYGDKPLHPDIVQIANGSYQEKNRSEIKAGAMAVQTLEAALWAFYNDNNSFHNGALKCVNLGDDTDTVAAIYGQLAGATYGEQQLHPQWLERVYAGNFIAEISKWLQYEGYQWKEKRREYAKKLKN